MKHLITKCNITKSCDERDLQTYLKRGWVLNGKKESEIVKKKSQLEELTVKQLIEKIISLGGTPKSSNTKAELIEILIEIEG